MLYFVMLDKRTESNGIEIEFRINVKDHPASIYADLCSKTVIPFAVAQWTNDVISSTNEKNLIPVEY